MTGNDTHEFSFAEAVRVVNCSESTLRRKLQKNGSTLGATKTKKGWRIPVTTLEALGVLDTVTGSDTPRLTGSDTSQMSDLKVQLARLEERTKQQEQLIAQLRDQLNDKERAIKLLEAAPAAEESDESQKKPWWKFF